MAGRKGRVVSVRLARLQERFGKWRQTRKFGTKIPERLWTSAAKAAASYGVSQTALALGLDYYALKKRVEQSPSDSTPPRRPASTPAFVELADSPAFASARECIVEFEDVEGAKMRVHLKGGDGPDLIDLARGFWGARR